MRLYLQNPETSYCVAYGMLGIAHYYGMSMTKSEMIKLLKTHKTRGTDVGYVAKSISEIGLKFKRFKFNYRNVKRAIDAGKPIAICYEMAKGVSHFSTIIETRKNSRGLNFYTLNDTYYGRYEIPEYTLKYLMQLDGSWARIVETI